jgi:midasin (ATPase involved in ribosome maturation)
MNKGILESVALAICLSQPLLLMGPIGCGKTSLIYELAFQSGNVQTLQRVFLEDQSDINALTGTYVATRAFGNFVWQPGPLLRAISEGYWLLIENIKLVSQALLTVLDMYKFDKNYNLPQKNFLFVQVAGFQLLAIFGNAFVTFNNQIMELEANSKKFGDLWFIVNFEDPLIAEICNILLYSYSNLFILMNGATKTFEIVKLKSKQELSTDTKDEFILHQYLSIVKNDGITYYYSSFQSVRFFSIRDLVNWSQRMCKLHKILLKKLCHRTSTLILSYISISIREAIITELIEIFCMSISKKYSKWCLSCVLYSIWSINCHTLRYFNKDHYVDLNFLKKFVSFGRALVKYSVSYKRNTIPLSTTKSSKKYVYTNFFKYTNYNLCIAEQITISIQIKESILLVGETGYFMCLS